MDTKQQLDEIQKAIDAIRENLGLNRSEKPNSSEPDYTHLLPDGYEFCTEEDAEKWVKVEIILSMPESKQMQVGYIWNSPTIPSTNRYRPIRPIAYHISVHESVTAEPIQEVAEYYQPLFNLLHQEHNVIATQTELDEIIRTAESLRNAEPDKYIIEKHGDTWVILEPSPKDNNWTIVGKFHDDRVASYIFKLLKGFKDDKPDPYQVDWSNAPEGTVAHHYQMDDYGWFDRLTIFQGEWVTISEQSGHTLPSGLDWKKSLRLNPKLK